MCSQSICPLHASHLLCWRRPRLLLEDQTDSWEGRAGRRPRHCWTYSSTAGGRKQSLGLIHYCHAAVLKQAQIRYSEWKYRCISIKVRKSIVSQYLNSLQGMTVWDFFGSPIHYFLEFLCSCVTCWNWGELIVLWISSALCSKLSPLGRNGRSLCWTAALVRMGAIISGVQMLARSTRGQERSTVSHPDPTFHPLGLAVV